MTEYLSCAETAKLIRAALKEAFPATKFSVRSHTYSGGASINVRWTDGPTRSSVESVAQCFQGGYFDGMTDYKGGHTHKFQGREVHFGADFVFCDRDISDKHAALVKQAWAALSERQRGDLLWKVQPQNGWMMVGVNMPSSYMLDAELSDLGDDADKVFRQLSYSIPGAGTIENNSKLAESAQLERSY